MFFYGALKIYSAIAYLVAVAVIGVSVWAVIKKRRAKEPVTFRGWLQDLKHDVRTSFKGYAFLLLTAAILATLITRPTIHQLVGVHNLELKPEGVYCFYVDAYSYGKKTYTLPAEVRVVKDYDYDEDPYIYYQIERVYFSNGGWLNTEDTEHAKIGDPFYFEDSQGKEWELTLLNEHAYSPYVTETDNATPRDIAWVILDVLPFAFLLFVSLIKEKANEYSQ